MTRIIHTTARPSVVHFDRLPRQPFTLSIAAHGVVVTFTGVAVSRGSGKDRFVECDFDKILTMVDGDGEIVADAATRAAIRNRIVEIGILTTDVRDGGYDCHTLEENAGSKAVALREFSSRVARETRNVLEERSVACLDGEEYAILEVPEARVRELREAHDPETALLTFLVDLGIDPASAEPHDPDVDELPDFAVARVGRVDPTDYNALRWSADLVVRLPRDRETVR